MAKYFLDNESRFIIEDYGNVSAFSNFLPAVSGIWGIPFWLFYVNRGQGVVSMGLKDKDHSLIEFLPANRAYQEAGTVGFRTFVKTDNQLFYEPFRLNFDNKHDEKMIIESSEVTFEEYNRKVGLRFSVTYFTIPNMPLASCVRVLKIQNTSQKKRKITALDGVPKVIPFGCRDLFLKHLSRTVEAWMTTNIERLGGRETALFRLSVDPEDVAATRHIEGTNFLCSFAEQGSKKIRTRLVVDPQFIFGQDTSFTTPVKFLEEQPFILKGQVCCGRTPCGFSFLETELLPCESVTLFTLLGATFSPKSLEKHIPGINGDFIHRKRDENRNIMERIKNKALNVSSAPQFDEYIKCTYLDNVLRGGYPYSVNGKGIYYVFSRKHGDLERDYNKFRLLPSYCSEGEANYRDINQNRRVDLFFNPGIYNKNVVYFLNYMRMDGYNPLTIQGEKFYFDDDEQIKDILSDSKIPLDKAIFDLMKKGFYLGEIFNLLENKKVTLEDREGFIERIFKTASLEPQADFGEGFWIDHWRYNLDLLENFLCFYPDKIQELFLETKFMFWDDEFKVNERRKRYSVKEDKVYQLDSLCVDEDKKKLIQSRGRFSNFLRVGKGHGRVYKTNLAEKLVSLILNKVSTLDFEGIGVEMEAGKPGWCDSLNGLPAIFGSSLCETLELKRACLFFEKILRTIVEAGKSSVKISTEVHDFFKELDALLASYESNQSDDRDLFWWDNSNSLKEKFRNNVFWGIEGTRTDLEISRLIGFLSRISEKLDLGIQKAFDKRTGLYFTYFIYKIKEFHRSSHGVKITKAEPAPLPLFLEGPVHTLRVNKSPETYRNVRKSPLFDRELKMYKLNASLEKAPMEIGRSRAFPRGWLENESVWLHMEYKYLLEALKAGFYKEFYQDLFNCGVCFLSPERYGRSVLENSSFIASSVYPDKSMWGKGFVARLTGATSEMLNIWILMCLGAEPFILNEQRELLVQLSPLLKGELFTEIKRPVRWNDREYVVPEGCFAFLIFSSTLVVYHNPRRRNTYINGVKIKRIKVIEGEEITDIPGQVISPPLSYKFRQGELDEVHLYFD